MMQKGRFVNKKESSMESYMRDSQEVDFKKDLSAKTSRA